MIYELYIGNKSSIKVPKKKELKALVTEENLELEYLLLYSKLPKNKKIYIMQDNKCVNYRFNFNLY